jgi:hypothetical protein
MKYRESWKTKLSICLSWNGRRDDRKEHVLINDNILGKPQVETRHAYRRQRLPIYIPENQPDWIGASLVGD